MADPNPIKNKTSFTDFLRKHFKGILEPIGRYVNKLGIHPNTITLIGLFGHIGAAVLLAFGEIVWGGVVALLMSPLDALDGTMARLRGTPKPFGGFLDSVTDRYAEIFLLGGLFIYFSHQDATIPLFLIFLAVVGSLMVSYVRARAEAQGYQLSGGLLTRVERYLIVIICLLINRPMIAIWILAIFTNITAWQRIWIVYRQAMVKRDI